MLKLNIALLTSRDDVRDEGMYERNLGKRTRSHSEFTK